MMTMNSRERECLKFCFVQAIQKELNTMVRNWNLHRIRPSNNAESPSGVPDVLYFNHCLQNLKIIQFVFHEKIMTLLQPCLPENLKSMGVFRNLRI